MLKRLIGAAAICVLLVSGAHGTSVEDLPQTLEDAIIQLRDNKFAIENQVSYVKKDIANGLLPANEDPVVRLIYQDMSTANSKIIDSIVADIKQNPALITKRRYEERIKALENRITGFDDALDIVYGRHYPFGTRPSDTSPLVVGTAVVGAITGIISSLAIYLNWLEKRETKDLLIKELKSVRWLDYQKIPDVPQKKLDFNKPIEIQP